MCIYEAIFYKNIEKIECYIHLILQIKRVQKTKRLENTN